jgi:hypothetical protein
MLPLDEVVGTNEQHGQPEDIGRDHAAMRQLPVTAEQHLAQPVFQQQYSHSR